MKVVIKSFVELASFYYMYLRIKHIYIHGKYLKFDKKRKTENNECTIKLYVQSNVTLGMFKEIIKILQ